MTDSISRYMIAPNEALNVGSVNRVIEHLLKNDDLLLEKLNASAGAKSVVLWTKGTVYHPGDVVVYVTATKTGVKMAYILACIANTHTEPTAALKNDLKELESCGWKLMHETTVYLNDQELLKTDVLQPAVEESIADHEGNNPHYGTIIESTDDFEKLFLKNDLSNYMSPKYPGGAYKAGSRMVGKYDEQTGNYVVKSTDGVTEQEIRFSFNPEANRNIEILNNRYYWEYNSVKEKSDSCIFSPFHGESFKTIELTNGLTYRNLRVPGTNVFSCTIDFPIPFLDSTYMIFQSSYTPNQFAFGQSASDLATLKDGNNAVFVGNIMFTNKLPNQVTAILPIHTHFSQYGQYAVGVPWTNEFRITVVGVTEK